MRAGGYTVHQSLTAEAAAVLKLSLGLARRRGHAQVTPLHVAYTLLGASPEPPPPSSPTPAYGLLLRRACAKSRTHPGGVAVSMSRYAQPHPAQCRALDLCFNVALNRLPTANTVMMGSSPSASFAASLLHHPSPTLSNALVAALKRAQANQRRGCVELQGQPSPPGPGSQSTSSPPQQPTLTIKMELDQLIVSILDDPSVSRVMREAGFSSAAVKTNLEEESADMLLGPGDGNHQGSSTPSSYPAPPPQFFLDPYGGFPAHAGGTGAMWPAAPFFINHQPEVESQPPCNTSVEDVRAILEVMTRRQGRRANPVVVGDSVSAAEASVAELMRRMERGDVPDELRGARVLLLHLSHVHVRLMTRPDVDAWAADLRRSVASITGSDETGRSAGIIIYVGDMRWAVDSNDDARGGQAAATGLFSPAEHLVAELARLVGAASRGGRAWLVAAASYGTFMRCQWSSSSLEATWDLQPVAVPAGGGLDLELGPRAATASPADGKAAQPAWFPLLDLAPKREDAVPMPALCAECARHYESEASAARANAEGTNLALAFFPGWPQADEPQTSHKDELIELKSKWSRLCQRVHSQSNLPARPPNATTISSSPGLCLSFEAPSSFHGRSKAKNQEVKTTLSLLLPESVQTSDEVHRHDSEDTDALPLPAAQERDAASKSSDKKSVPWLWTVELPSGDVKRKAESVRMPSESKRWKGNGGLDLNLRADEEDGGNGCCSSEDELVPSDLTNDGEASGGVTDSLDSHRQAAMTFGH